MRKVSECITFITQESLVAGIFLAGHPTPCNTVIRHFTAHPGETLNISEIQKVINGNSDNLDQEVSEVKTKPTIMMNSTMVEPRVNIAKSLDTSLLNAGFMCVHLARFSPLPLCHRRNLSFTAPQKIGEKNINDR
ncbi:hypothetical protein CAAN3_15S03928 [[Candida] anglica]